MDLTDLERLVARGALEMLEFKKTTGELREAAGGPDGATERTWAR